MDFLREYEDDVLILTVNLKQATFWESDTFNSIFVSEIGNGCRKFVVDLRSCNSVDPVFLGVLIVTLKKLASLKGSIKIIVPEIGFNLEKSTMYSLRLFETFKTKKNALESFYLLSDSRTELQEKAAVLPSFNASLSFNI